MGAQVIILVALFAAIFGIYFMRSRENLAMIEKGINPRKAYPTGPKPYAYMKYSLLLIGAGTGLFIAYMMDITYLYELSYRKLANGSEYYQDNPAVYFALLAIGGGIGLFCAYKIEKKHWTDNKPTDTGVQ